MANINGIANLPAQTPTGSSLLAIENSSATGQATVDAVVGASTPVSELNSNLTGEILDVASGSDFKAGVQLFKAGFHNFKFVDLYFSFQGWLLPAVRLITNYNSENKYGLNLGFINTSDNGLRQIIGQFTNSGGYLGSLKLSMGIVSNSTGTTQTWSDISSSGSLKLVRTIGYPARS